MATGAKGAGRCVCVKVGAGGAATGVEGRVVGQMQAQRGGPGKGWRGGVRGGEGPCFCTGALFAPP